MEKDDIKKLYINGSSYDKFIDKLKLKLIFFGEQSLGETTGENIFMSLNGELLYVTEEEVKVEEQGKSVKTIAYIKRSGKNGNIQLLFRE